MKKPSPFSKFLELVPNSGTINTEHEVHRDQDIVEKILHPKKNKINDYIEDNYKLFLEHFNIKNFPESTKKRIRTFYTDITNEKLSDQTVKEINELDKKAQYYYKNFKEIEDDLSFGKKNRVNMTEFFNQINDNNLNQEVFKFFGLLSSVYSAKLVNRVIGNIKFLYHEQPEAFIAYANITEDKSMIYASILGASLYDQKLNNFIYNSWMQTNNSRINTLVHELGHVFSLYSSLNRIEKSQINKNNTLLTDINVGYPSDFVDDKRYELGGYHLFSWLKDNYLSGFEKEYEQYLAAYALVPSLYAAYWSEPSNIAIHFDEYFAEAFAYWILTPKNRREGSWQIMHRYFTSVFKDRLERDIV